MIRQFDRWAKLPCDECGEEFHVTRTEPAIIDGPVLCESCESYLLGFAAGRQEAIAAIKAEPEYLGELPGDIQKLLLHALVHRDMDSLVRALQLSVKLTKDGIINRLEKK